MTSLLSANSRVAQNTLATIAAFRFRVFSFRSVAQNRILMQVCFRLGLTLAVSFSLYGCGGGPDDMPEIGTVSGKITVGGQPGANLVVTFQPPAGRPSYATTNAEGNYELRYNKDTMGAKLGSNLVTISTESDGGDGEDYGDGTDGSAASLEGADAIPAKYNTQASQNPEMTVEVKAGANEFNWDVQAQ